MGCKVERDGKEDDGRVAGEFGVGVYTVAWDVGENSYVEGVGEYTVGAVAADKDASFGS